MQRYALLAQQLTILKRRDGIFDPFFEPYVLALVCGQDGKQAQCIAQPMAGIKSNKPVQFQGDGLLLWGWSDPGDWLAWHIVVMESEAKTRAIASRLEQAPWLQVSTLLASAVSASATGPLLAAGVELLLKSIANKSDETLMVSQGSLLLPHATADMTGESAKAKLGYRLQQNEDIAGRLPMAPQQPVYIKKLT